MTYEELVQKAKSIYEGVDASNINEHIAFQFDVRGEGEGAFYMEVADGKVMVEPYEYYNHDALITTSQDMLLQIATGQVDPINAYFTHKIKVDGDLGKAARLKELSDAAVELAKKMAEEEAAKSAPAEEAKAPAAAPKKRGRRSKAEIEAAKAAEAAKTAEEAKTPATEAAKAEAEEVKAPKKRGRRSKAEIEAAKAAETAKAEEVKAAEAAETEEVKAPEKETQAEEAPKAPAKRRPGRPRKNA